MKDLLISREQRVTGVRDEDAVDTILLRIQAAIVAVPPGPVGSGEDRVSPQAIEHELHLREVTANDLVRALSEADIEIVSPSAQSVSDLCESEGGLVSVNQAWKKVVAANGGTGILSSLENIVLSSLGSH